MYIQNSCTHTKGCAHTQKGVHELRTQNEHIQNSCTHTQKEKNNENTFCIVQENIRYYMQGVRRFRTHNEHIQNSCAHTKRKTTKNTFIYFNTTLYSLIRNNATRDRD